MGFFTFIIVAIVGIFGYLFFKGFSNTRFTADENEFKQGGVTVNFKKQTIEINGNNYNVNQVTGIRTKAFQRETRRNASSKAKNVIIEVDDFKKPTHKVLFVTSGQAEKFMQRLSTALRKAGGPNFT
jgi:hypothetical protein